jgi:tRNA (guanine37-N1)-methyltransferase
MRFDVITLLPEIFAPFLTSGVTRRAYESKAVDVRLWNPRDFADGSYRRVDDRPFGGGPGMVMMAEPLSRCLERIKADRAAGTPFEPPEPPVLIDVAADSGGAGPFEARPAPSEGSESREANRERASPPVVLFSPVGRRLDHAAVEGWSAGEGAVLVCGRYEGIDQRFIDEFVDHQISLGDFVLSGGEIAAMALIDAVARLQPGVLNGEGSHQFDSFNPALDGLLDCPHYTRPEVWRGQAVPPILLSGNHAQIERWRRDQQLAFTRKMRPDLLQAARAAGCLTAGDEAFLADLLDNPDQDA